jgi:hypothetical protein
VPVNPILAANLDTVQKLFNHILLVLLKQILTGLVMTLPVLQHHRNLTALLHVKQILDANVMHGTQVEVTHVG